MTSAPPRCADTVSLAGDGSACRWLNGPLRSCNGTAVTLSERRPAASIGPEGCHATAAAEATAITRSAKNATKTGSSKHPPLNRDRREDH